MLTAMAIRRSNLRWMILGLAIFVVCGGLAFRMLLDRLEPDVIVGEPAPAVTLTAADGSPVHLATLKGKVVLLELWSAT